MVGTLCRFGGRNGDHSVNWSLVLATPGEVSRFEGCIVACLVSLSSKICRCTLPSLVVVIVLVFLIPIV